MIFSYDSFFLFILFSAAKSDLAADKAALLSLSSAVGGRTLLWNLADPSPCSWQGVYCDENASEASSVIQLRLPGSGLSGRIPFYSIGKMTNLQYLSLRKNSLSGSLPSDLRSCTLLQSIFLQENNFSDQIPATIFALTNLVRLNLAGNRFSGKMSPEFNNLALLRTLNLENNNLTGPIPEMNNLSGLREFNVSYNQLNGSIPSGLIKFSNDSFLGNSLCGSPLADCPTNNEKGGNKLSAGAIAGIIMGSLIGLILIIVILFFLMRKRSPQTTPPQAEMYRSQGKPQVLEFSSPKPLLAREHSGDRGLRSQDSVIVNVVQRGRDDGLVYFGHGNVVFGLEDLLRAPAEVVGKGTFGSTYKAYLEGGNKEEVVVVVKRLRSVRVSETEFREKVENLGMLVHENLMPLIAYYYGREEKLIVCNCIPMGSLSDLLHGNGGVYRAALTWEIRAKIAFGAAHGIEYLHSLGSNICHGDIKSSNILLADSYSPRVCDYGMSQLVSRTSTLDQNGYRAPEVIDSRKISQQADVYSFGVLLLELFTAKAPTHAFSDEEGVDLPRWVRSVSKENQMMEVFDPELLRHENNEEQMVQLLHVGIHCTSRHPDKRPPMFEVIRHIRKVVI